MEPTNTRWMIIGSAALIVLTQVACTVWIGKEMVATSPADSSSELENIREQLAGVETAVGDVQETADTIQGRTGALTDSMSSVARACAFR